MCRLYVHTATTSPASPYTHRPVVQLCDNLNFTRFLGTHAPPIAYTCVGIYIYICTYVRFAGDMANGIPKSFLFGCHRRCLVVPQVGVPFIEALRGLDAGGLAAER